MRDPTIKFGRLVPLFILNIISLFVKILSNKFFSILQILTDTLQMKRFVNADDVKTKFSKFMINFLRLRTCFKTRLKLNYHNLPWTRSAFEWCSFTAAADWGHMVHCRADMLCSLWYTGRYPPAFPDSKQKFFIFEWKPGFVWKYNFLIFKMCPSTTDAKFKLGYSKKKTTTKTINHPMDAINCAQCLRTTNNNQVYKLSYVGPCIL